jgi:hypothetical protein
MNTRNLTLLAVGLVVGAVGAFVYFRTARPVIENAKYVIAFNGVSLANESAFIAALKVPEKAVFRRDMKILRPGGNVEQPPGLEDAGDTQVSVMKLSYGAEPKMGQQVTQRVGFNNRENLVIALSYVSPTPTPTPSP